LSEVIDSREPLEAGFASTLRICALLDLVRALHQAHRSSQFRDVLAQHVVALIRELIPADRGVVLLEDQFDQDPSLDKKLMKRLVAEKAALSNSAEDRHALLVPLLVHREVAGAIYLESHCPVTPFDESRQLLLTAIAEIASVALENAYHVEWLQHEVERLEGDLNFDEMAGNSRKMAELRKKIARVASTNTTVLIMGESGTGKELVARSLHRNSPRANEPFVAINCAALTETLLESELFGYEKGAFTGASTQKRGRLESGQGGTVFLDEIGEMPLSLQAKILRVLQSREFERVGSTRSISLDIRLIAATNRDLQSLVRHGLFREDLFYRLNVICLQTPPLREHAEDVLALAHYFVVRFSEKCGRHVSGISPGARTLLRNYDWPGNVRELENAIEHAIVLGSGDTIQSEDLPEAIKDRWIEAGSRETGLLQEAITTAKRAAIKRAFDITKQDHNEAAHLLGVHPNYLYRLLRNLGLQPFARDPDS
jgi:transcriptional regulator with PAS, ATPase and Fis domain